MKKLCSVILMVFNLFVFSVHAEGQERDAVYLKVQTVDSENLIERGWLKSIQIERFHVYSIKELSRIPFKSDSSEIFCFQFKTEKTSRIPNFLEVLESEIADNNIVGVGPVEVYWGQGCSKESFQKSEKVI